jgi:hypothetical protein
LLPLPENPEIEVDLVEDGLKARHKRDGHWAVFRWPGSGTDMVFANGHCDDKHYWTYEKFRTDAHVAVNARARVTRTD